MYEIKTNQIDEESRCYPKNYYSPQHWLHDTDWFIWLVGAFSHDRSGKL